MLKIMELAGEKGSSTWLTALPLEEHRFMLHKCAFHDALALWYGWPPQNMPFTCARGSKASIEHNPKDVDILGLFYYSCFFFHAG